MAISYAAMTCSPSSAEHGSEEWRLLPRHRPWRGRSRGLLKRAARRRRCVWRGRPRGRALSGGGMWLSLAGCWTRPIWLWLGIFPTGQSKPQGQLGWDRLIDLRLDGGHLGFYALKRLENGERAAVSFCDGLIGCALAGLEELYHLSTYLSPCSGEGGESHTSPCVTRAPQSRLSHLSRTSMSFLLIRCASLVDVEGRQISANASRKVEVEYNEVEYERIGFVWRWAMNAAAARYTVSIPSSGQGRFEPRVLAYAHTPSPSQIASKARPPFRPYPTTDRMG